MHPSTFDKRPILISSKTAPPLQEITCQSSGYCDRLSLKIIPMLQLSATFATFSGTILAMTVPNKKEEIELKGQNRALLSWHMTRPRAHQRLSVALTIFFQLLLSQISGNFFDKNLLITVVYGFFSRYDCAVKCIAVLFSNPFIQRFIDRWNISFFVHNSQYIVE